MLLDEGIRVALVDALQLLQTLRSESLPDIRNPDPMAGRGRGSKTHTLFSLWVTGETRKRTKDPGKSSSLRGKEDEREQESVHSGFESYCVVLAGKPAQRKRDSSKYVAL